MRSARGLPVTIGYVSAVGLVAAASRLLGPPARARLASGASTHLGHLRRRPHVVLPASAFVLAEPLHAVLLAPLALAMATVERRRGSGQTAAILALGHLGATGLVAAGLSAGISLGWVDAARGEEVDVGVSYGGLAVAAVALADVPRGRQAGRAVTVALATVWLLHREPVDAGHLAAWLLGGAALSAGGPPDRGGPRATRRRGC